MVGTVEIDRLPRDVKKMKLSKYELVVKVD